MPHSTDSATLETSMSRSINPVILTQELIRCPSITPKDGGAIGVLEKYLEPLGFICHPLTFHEPDTQPVSNLYARYGTEGRNFCFAGHTDVVPVGDEEAWKRPPFEAAILDDVVYGRGAVDMKTSIAAFAAAAENFLAEHPDFNESISFLITGDEEGPAINGTRKVLEWLKYRDETLDACIVGEPTNPERMGQMAKIGRRGSITFNITVHGIQGHVAYPHFADNPVKHLVKILSMLTEHTLDKGNKFFQPSNLEVTTIDVGNPATNVIPAHARATFNIRFNDEHNEESLFRLVKEICDKSGAKVDIHFECSGEAFLTKPGFLSDVVSAAVKQVSGAMPELSTTGGTSDARFIKDFCPVVEYGAINKTAHKVDESIAIKDILALTETYKVILQKFFYKK